MQHTTTIPEFRQISIQEWRKYNSNKHEEDQSPYEEFLSENNEEYKKKYGIQYIDGNHQYCRSNSNWSGDDVCDCCECYYNSETEGSDGMCDDCLNEEIDDYDEPEDSPTGHGDICHSDADSGL